MNITDIWKRTGVTVTPGESESGCDDVENAENFVTEKPLALKVRLREIWQRYFPSILLR